MKKMLIAATAVGAAIAGIVLYNRRRNSAARLWSGAAKDAYKRMNNGLGKLERDPWHSMG